MLIAARRLFPGGSPQTLSKQAEESRQESPWDVLSEKAGCQRQDLSKYVCFNKSLHRRLPRPAGREE